MLHKGKRGFSLIELIVVMAVIAILVLIASPIYMNYTKDARLKQIQSDVKSTGDKLASYYTKNNDELPSGSTQYDAASLTDADLLEGSIMRRA